MLIVPLQAVPSQTVQAMLGGQSVKLSIYQKMFGLFVDVSVSGTPVVSGILCQNLNRIIRDAYLGFVGDLAFIDTQGMSDPVSTGLGSRYTLNYLTTADLATLGFAA